MWSLSPPPPSAPLEPQEQPRFTREDWRAQAAELVVTLSGVDGTFGQTIHARKTYTVDDLVHGADLVAVLTVREDGKLEIDYAHFHEVAPREPT